LLVTVAESVALFCARMKMPEPFRLLPGAPLPL